MRSLTLFLFLVTASVLVGQSNVTLEKLWQDYEYVPNWVPGFNFQNDGKHYTRLEENQVVQYDLLTGKKTDVIFDPASLTDANGFSGNIGGYTFSEDERKLLIRSETERIYRHSTRAKYFIYDRDRQSITPIFKEGKIRYATFNPDASKVGFVYANNLYYYDVAKLTAVQVTRDGEINAVINGGTDWVYEEEFSFHRGFQWSPDGQKIAFYRFDERAVPEFTMTNYRDGMYPEYVTFKYPKVGENNATVTIHVHDLKSGKTIETAVSQTEEYYIPRIKWTQDPNQLCVTRMNRHQNHLELLLVNAKSGKSTMLLEERSKYYIDITDNLTFLKNGKQFVWTSETDGWNHIYLYDMNGKKQRQLTSGKWEVTNFYGVDEASGMIYFQAAKTSPMDRDVLQVSLKGGTPKPVVSKIGKGWSSAQFSSTYDYLVLTHSTLNSPATYGVYNRKGKSVRMIETNEDLMAVQEDHAVQPAEFFSFTTSDDVQLNGYMIKPPNMNPKRKHPVLMFVYGGPGSQQAVNSWRGQNYWWFQMLAQQGYVVACVDNRGTGGRGEEFKKMTYLKLGHYETIDQIEAAKYLGKQSYIDADRIGIFGWSYGGYMSSLAILKGADVFKAAIAVAPVTNWKWYDTIYTERYMRTEKENPDGYKDNSPVYFADKLKGAYLLIHGMGDDNVHFQHAAEMANALIMANKQFDTYYYPNRAHGISGGPTRLHLYTKMTNFLNKNLKAKSRNTSKHRPKGAPLEKREIKLRD